MKTPLSSGIVPLLPGALLSLGALLFTAGSAMAADTLAWDKTFPQSPNVVHQKVSFNNRLGITLVADLYLPKNLDRSKKHAAIVVGGPYGAVKEQSAGLYAQTMAERGFVTVAHDPSYNGESGGQPHFTASSEALIEDFSAAVDYLGTKPFVDRERIGVIGVCGSGSFGLAAAETDSRIKAVATVSMYDIGQAHRQGLADTVDTAAIKKSVMEISKLRWAEVDGAERTMAIGTPQVLTENSSAIDREFFDYYRTPRGRHPRSSTAFWRTGGYAGEPFAEVQIARRSELHTFAVIPKRWVVERSFAWLEKCRRLWKNCERTLNTSLQFVNLAFLVLLLRRS